MLFLWPSLWRIGPADRRHSGVTFNLVDVARSPDLRRSPLAATLAGLAASAASHAMPGAQFVENWDANGGGMVASGDFGPPAN